MIWLALLVGVSAQGELRASTCVECHRAQHAAWQHSAHAQSFTNPVFQLEYQQSSRDWCLTCHAPMPAQIRGVHAGEVALALEGINCAACHLRDGKMLAASKRQGSPHDTRADPLFGGPAYCASCHQFSFPRFSPTGELAGYAPTPMQDTLREYERVHRGGGEFEGCDDCHRPHEYGAVHAGDLVSDAVNVSVCVAGASLRVTLQAQGAGHAIPTGGVNRHFVLRAWFSHAPQRLHETFVGRTFAPEPDGTKRLERDTRLWPGEERTITIPLAALDVRGDGRLNVAWVYRFVSERIEEEALAQSVDAERVLWSYGGALAALPGC